MVDLDMNADGLVQIESVCVILAKNEARVPVDDV